MRAETLVRAGAHHVAKPWSFAEGWREPSEVWSSSWRCFSCAWCSYLLGDAFVHPLEAQALAVLGAALSITLASILLYFLLKPRHGQRPRTTRSGAGDSRKVALLENLPVVQLVPRGNKCQRPHAHLILVGRASSQPRIFPKRTKQRQTRTSHVRKLLYQTRQRPFAESAAAHVIVLFKSLKGVWSPRAIRSALYVKILSESLKCPSTSFTVHLSAA